jgi:hypothetical protein
MGLGFVIATLVLGGALAGCGGDGSDDGGATSATASGSDEEQIRDVADRFAQSIEDEDAELFCSLLAPADVKRAGGGDLQDCIRASDGPDNVLFAAPDADLSVESVVIKPGEDTATVTQVDGGFLTLVKIDGAWYVTFGTASAG